MSETAGEMSATAGKLTPANQNPWYVLMTLYGEQEGEAEDLVLHKQNLAAWNAWSCQAMGQEALERAAASSSVTVAELSAWPEMQAEVERRHKAEWLRRNGEDVAYPGVPDLADAVALDGVEFARHLRMEQAVFSGEAQFSRATFCWGANFGQATFCGGAWFNGVAFSREAQFSGATFSSEAHFGIATFSGEASFDGAKFSGGGGIPRRELPQGGELRHSDVRRDGELRARDVPRLSLF